MRKVQFFLSQNNSQNLLAKQTALAFKVGRAVPARRVLGITVLEPKGGAEGIPRPTFRAVGAVLWHLS